MLQGSLLEKERKEKGWVKRKEKEGKEKKRKKVGRDETQTRSKLQLCLM